MPLTIRQAVPGDVPAVVEFNRLLALETEGKALDPDILEPGVAAVLADPQKGLYFLAEDNGQAVGQLGITYEFSDWRNGWFWWLQSVYVKKEWRRKGVFRSLYGHIEEMARRDPEVIGLRLYVEEGNKAAQETYLKLGMGRAGYVLLEKFPLLKPAPATMPPLVITSQPSVIVLGGSNGAGKTTASKTLLADALRLVAFVNADVIAKGLAGFDPDSVAFEASRIMLDRLHALAAKQQSFAFETTLAARTYAPWLRQLRDAGYVVHLVYFWLGSADLAVARVAERVRHGGHDVPEATVRQRYQRSLDSFFKLYRPLADTWRVFTSANVGKCLPIAFGDKTGSETVLEEGLWRQMQMAAKL